MAGDGKTNPVDDIAAGDAVDDAEQFACALGRDGPARRGHHDRLHVESRVRCGVVLGLGDGTLRRG